MEFYKLLFKLSQLTFSFQLAQCLLFSKHLKSFQSFRKSKSWILLRSLLGHEVWDNWNFTYYHSSCLNYNSYSSWLNVCCSQNLSKVFRALEDQRAGYYWEVCKVMKFETIGILHIIIQIVSTKFLIPAGSKFVVLRTSQKFSEL